MNCRRVGGELGDLGDRIGEIRPCAQHCVHLASDIRLVLLEISCCRLFGGFDELCAGSDRYGYRCRVLHFESFEDHVDIATLENFEQFLLAIAVNLNAKEIS